MCAEYDFELEVLLGQGETVQAGLALGRTMDQVRGCYIVSRSIYFQVLYFTPPSALSQS